MIIKRSVATAIVVASVGAVSACGSSAAESGAPGPAAAATSTPMSAATSASATSTPATPTSATSTPAGPASSASQGSVRTDIPDSALLADADLVSAPNEVLKATGGSPTVAAADMFDVDHCDPVPHPQAEDPNYPRNPAWVNTRSKMWAGPGYKQVAESIITYTSAAEAQKDFTKHQGWIADCAPRFQWTDAPQKFAVSKIPMRSVSDDAYAIHVGMYGTNQPASSAGSQGYDYMAVILRGNSLTILDVSQTAVEGPKPHDPGPLEMQHDAEAAAAKLAAVYASSN
ncbi:MAG: hypothetical protein HOW97_30515 [Catenulispora sp.]|nr:hypothetical protein [Catenulispora sp.]